MGEYCSKVYKKKYTDEELKKEQEKAEKKKSNREVEQVHLFLEEHPQSETHWQRVRLKRSTMVPTLTKLPPSSEKNKLRYQKCVLLLFKPFTCLDELYNGISWDETYWNLMEVTDNKQYVENLQELHICMEEKQQDEENNDENNDEIDDDDDECDDDDPLDETEDKGLDSQTTEALDVIRNHTEWLK